MPAAATINTIAAAVSAAISGHLGRESGRSAGWGGATGDQPGGRCWVAAGLAPCWRTGAGAGVVGGVSRS